MVFVFFELVRAALSARAIQRTLFWHLQEVPSSRVFPLPFWLWHARAVARFLASPSLVPQRVALQHSPLPDVHTDAARRREIGDPAPRDTQWGGNQS